MLFVVIPSSKEMPAPVSNIVALQQKSMELKGIKYSGKCYKIGSQKSSFIVAGENCLLIEGSRKFFYARWNSDMKLIGFYDKALIVVLKKAVYSLTFDHLTLIPSTKIKRFHPGFLEFTSTTNVSYGVFRFNRTLHLYLSNHQKKIIRTASLVLRRKGVPKFLRQMILDLAF